MGEEMMKAKAHDIAMKMAMQHPEYNIVVSYKYVRRNCQERNAGMIVNRRNIGEISVYMGTHYCSGNIITDHNSREPEQHDDYVHNNVLSQSNKYSFLKALTMTAKVKLLRACSQDGLLPGETEMCAIKLLVDAIVSDIADENAKFQFGCVSVTMKLRSAVVKKSEAAFWAARLTNLQMLSNGANLGHVKNRGTKYFELVRMCVMLRLFMRNSIPTRQKMLKLTRAGLIARSSDILLTELENNLAQKAGVAVLRDSSGLTVQSATKKMLRNGLQGSGGHDRRMWLYSLRAPFSVGTHDLKKEDVEYHPLVISDSELDKLRAKHAHNKTPQIRQSLGKVSCEQERLDNIAKLLQAEPDKDSE